MDSKRPHVETGNTPGKRPIKRKPNPTSPSAVRNLFNSFPSEEQPGVDQAQAQAAIDAENHAAPPHEQPQAQHEVPAQPIGEPAPAPAPTSLSEIKELQGKLKDLEDEEENRQKRVSDLEETIQGIENELDRNLPDPSDIQIKELQGKLKDLQDEEENRQKRVSDLEKTIQGIENELDRNLPDPSDIQVDEAALEIKTKKENMEKMLEQFKKRRDEVTKKVRELKISSGELRQIVNDKLTKAQTKREQIEKEFKTKIKELQGELKGLQDEKTKSPKRMSDLEKTIKGLQNELDRNLLDSSDIQIKELQGKLKDLQDEEEKRLKRVSDLEETIQGIENELDRNLPDPSDIQVDEAALEIKTEKENMEKRREELKTHCDEVTKKVRELNISFGELQMQIIDVLKKRIQNEKKFKAKLSQIKELQGELKGLQDEKKKRQKRMSDLEKTIKGLQNELDHKLPDPSDIQPLVITNADLVWMKVALTVASRAAISEYAKEKPNVGCVIRRSRSKGSPAVLAVGWNGFLPNTREGILKDTAAECKGKKHDLTIALGLHAETNALRNCSENPDKATVYVTHVPCYKCAKELVSHRVKRVFYLFWMEYSESSIKLFKNFDISCIPFPGRSRNDVLRDFRETFLDIYNICEGSTRKAIPRKDSLYLSTDDLTSPDSSNLKRSVSQELHEYRKQHIIQIMGVPEKSPQETVQDTSDLCVALFKEMRPDPEITINDIDTAQRTAKGRDSDGPRPIICRFVRRLAKDSVMSVKQQACDVNLVNIGFSENTADVSKIRICDYDQDSQEKTEEASFTQ